MATASDNPDVSIRVMEDDLSCNICYNLLREPKDLDCPHVFCLKCIQEWTKKKPTIDCPECRHITIVPQGGLTTLKTNLRLRTMAEKYTERVEKQKGVPICPNHEGERQHFFCVTCGITVCNNCLVLEHPRPDHEIKELKIIAKTRKAEMKTKMDRVQEEVRQENKDKTELGEMENQLKASADMAEKGIKKRIQETIAEAEARGKEMIACVQATYQQRLQTIKEKENGTTDRLTRLQNVHLATQNVVETAADHVYIKQHASLRDKMDRLCISQEGMPPDDITALRFVSGSGPVNKSWFGEVVTSSNTELKLKLITEFGNFQKAKAVAETHSGLLAVVDADAKLEEVAVYCNVNGEYKRRFCLGDSAGDPGGKPTLSLYVAATAGKFLISDNVVVKVFSAAGRYERSWAESVVAGRITTTPDDLIVIGSGSKRVITMHQSNGELIRTHQADRGNMQDIASNGKQIAITTGRKGKVCVIDFVTGQTLWTVDMVMPLGICYEQKSNTLLVAGGSKTKGHHVIEQYCSTTGRLLSRLAGGLYNPYAMTVTHDNKLVVADLKTVKIYSIQ